MSDKELLMKIANDIGNLQGDVRAILNNQEAQDARLNSHSTRLGSLERSRSWVNGVTAAISVVVSAVVTFISTR